jgi:uncharacterized RDD family membrane protein YckC
LLGLAWLLVPCGAGAAQGLAVAAADGHVWLAQLEQARGPEPAKVVIYHGALGPGHDGSSLELERVARLPGELALRDLAAREQILIVPLRSGVLRRVRVTPGRLPDTWAMDSSVLARLPAGAALRGLATEAEEPVWALVRRDRVPPTPPDVPASADDQQESRQRTLERVLGLPPGALAETDTSPLPAEASPVAEEQASEVDVPPADAGPTEKPDPDSAPAADETEPGAEPPAEPEPADRPTDALVVLKAGQWAEQPLPADWPTGQPAWLLLRDREPGGRPMLATLPPGGGSELWTWHWTGQQWSQEVVQLAGQRGRVAALVEVAGQVVVVFQPTGAGQGVSVSAAVLRHGQLTPIGDLRLDVPAGSAWSVTAIGHHLALIAQPPGATAESPALVWARLTLQGEARPAEPLPLVTPDEMAEAPGLVLQTGVLVLVLALVVLFWRRDAGLQVLGLPRGIALADLGRRSLGGLIDLAVVLGPVMLIGGYDAREMYHHWPTSPGPGMTWPGMLPGVIVVVGFVAHTTVAEVFTGRSLGKWLLKMRVANLQGEPASKAQRLSRSLLKVFDVIAWLPLVLPLIGPYRQRLGDIVARTVVVTGTKQPEKPEAEELDVEA